MFGPEHYVAGMRLKRAELKALRKLSWQLRSRITPLLECPRRTLAGCESANQLDNKFAAIMAYLVGWSGRALFLDLGMVARTSPQAIKVIADHATRCGVRPVPVVSLITPPDSIYADGVRAVIQSHAAGLCLRLSPTAISRLESIDELVDDLLKSYGVSPSAVDLVVDRGSVDSGSITFPEIAHRIPLLDAWRTLTLLGGSFPPDLSGLARGETHRLRRFEWTQWKALESWRGRRPSFGDFAIQHVTFKEPVPGCNPSASVRYTIEDDFLVLRGEGILNAGGPGRGQWNAWASLLVESADYLGPAFSPGDQYIAERAADWQTTGTPESWLEAGFSHHLTIAALQVAGRLEAAREVARSAADWTGVAGIEGIEAPSYR